MVNETGNTVLDRLHQAMILFAAGRSEAMRRFLVEEGVGCDGRFWTLAQALSVLYPSGSDEKRARFDTLRSSSIVAGEALQRDAASVAGDFGNGFSNRHLDADGHKISPCVTQRSRRDSNPRNLSVERFSRPSP